MQKGTEKHKIGRLVSLLWGVWSLYFIIRYSFLAHRDTLYLRFPRCKRERTEMDR